MNTKQSNLNIGLFIIRFAIGIVFLIHGIDKASDIGSVVSFFTSIGLAPFMAYIVTGLEIIAGAAMIIGLYEQFAAFLIVVIMLFAIYLVKYPQGFIGGYEFDLLLLLVALGIGLTGPGTYALRTRKNMTKDDVVLPGEDLKNEHNQNETA